MLKIFLFLFTILPSIFTAKYDCYSYPNNNQLCEIVIFNFQGSDYKIEPQTPNPTAITKFRIIETIPVLSNGFCEAFPNLKEVYTYVKDVQNYAFEACEELTELIMRSNSFVRFGEKSFKGLISLETLFIEGKNLVGNLSELDLDLADLKNLKNLTLTGLNLTKIKPNVFRGLKNLEYLNLASNGLMDLNIEEILENAPNLRTINFVDNILKCSQVVKILLKLKEKNISVETAIDELKTRKEEMVENIHCLSDS